jgi:hypothetical protein
MTAPASTDFTVTVGIETHWEYEEGGKCFRYNGPNVFHTQLFSAT